LQAPGARGALVAGSASRLPEPLDTRLLVPVGNALVHNLAGEHRVHRSASLSVDGLAAGWFDTDSLGESPDTQ
jgi:hypothetical protein